MNLPAESSASVFDIALQIARLGLRVAFAHGVTDALECACGDPHEKTRSSIGKHPIGKLWQRKATTDAYALQDAYVPGCNVGIVCGEQPDGRIVVAVDVDDAARFASLSIDYGDLPPTLSGRSPRGLRLFFLSPESLPNRTGLGGHPGVDLKASNGFVVTGPSRHPSGVLYSWDDLSTPIAELPPAWLALVRPAPKPPKPLVSFDPSDKKARNRAEKWTQSILNSETNLLAATAEGSRNQTLHHATIRVVSAFRGVHLPESQAQMQLAHAAEQCGLGDLETRRTIASAIKYLDETGGKRTPPDRPMHLVEPPSGTHSVPPPDPPPGDAINLVQYRGAPADIPENIARIISLDPLWCGGPRFDRCSTFILWPQPLPEPLANMTRMQSEVSPTDYSVIQTHCLTDHALKTSAPEIERGLRLLAHQRSFDALIDFADSLPSWDHVPRIDTWLTRYFGCDDTPYHRVTGRAFLRAVMMRARRPGAFCDIIPILQGGQKSGKNHAIEILFRGGPANAPWLSPMGLFLPDHPNTRRLVCSRWIVHDDEFSARDAKQVDAMKSWASRTNEEWVPKYSNDVLCMHRRALLICSVNDDRPLSDPTGARRWLVWRVAAIDIDALDRDRLQLLAEASLSDDWQEGLPDIEAEQKEVAGLATTEDGLDSSLLSLHEWTDWLSTSDLSFRLGVPPERQSRSWTTRLGQACQRVGCRHFRMGKKNVTGYFPPDS